MWFFNIVGWVWWLVNWPTNALLGDNLFDLMIEMLLVLFFIAICAIPVTFVVAILRGIWNALSGDSRYVITFSEHIGRVLVWKRRASSYKIAFVITAILIVPPHLFMSWELREHKTEFKHRATHVAHYEVFYGGPGEPGEFDYGGKLDEMVIARSQVLARRQFVPYFTAEWRTQSLGITYVPGAYVYTYLPKNMYNGAIASVVTWLSGEDKSKFLEEFQKFLNEDVWTPPTKTSVSEERVVIFGLVIFALVVFVVMYRRHRLGDALVWYGFVVSLLALAGMSLAW